MNLSKLISQLGKLFDFLVVVLLTFILVILIPDVTYWYVKLVPAVENRSWQQAITIIKGKNVTEEEVISKSKLSEEIESGLPQKNVQKQIIKKPSPKISSSPSVTSPSPKISSSPSANLLLSNKLIASLTINDAFDEAENKYNSGDCRGAIQILSQIINLAPNNLKAYDQRTDRYYISEAYSSRGYYYYTLGQFKNAILDYNKVLASGTKDPEEITIAFWGRGKSHHELGNLKSAIQDITQGINTAKMQRYGKQHDSYNVRLRLMHTDRGITKYKLGDVVGAFNDFENGEPNYCNEHNKRFAKAYILGKKLNDSDFPRGLKPSTGILTREQCRSIIYGIKKGQCRSSSYYPFD